MSELYFHIINMGLWTMMLFFTVLERIRTMDLEKQFVTHKELIAEQQEAIAKQAALIRDLEKLKGTVSEVRYDNSCTGVTIDHSGHHLPKNGSY